MDSLFFLLSKTIALLIQPDSLIVLLTVFSSFCLWLKRKTLLKYSLTLVSLIILGITILPVGDVLMYSLESSYPKTELTKNIDGFIVLGGALKLENSIAWDSIEIGESNERVFTFIQMIKKFPKATFIFSGGNGSLTTLEESEASLAKKLLKEFGVNIDNIIFEDKSKNTFQNVSFSKQIIKPNANEKWVLITSASHMPRAVAVFKKQNWHVMPYPVDYQSQKKEINQLQWQFLNSLKLTTQATREYLGYWIYQLTNKI